MQRQFCRRVFLTCAWKSEKHFRDDAIPGETERSPLISLTAVKLKVYCPLEITEKCCTQVESDVSVFSLHSQVQYQDFVEIRSTAS